MKKFIMSIVALVAGIVDPFFCICKWLGLLREKTLYSNGAESHVYDSTGGDYKICRDPYVGPAG